MRTVFTKSLALLVVLLGGSTLAFAQLSGNYTIDASGSGSRNYTSVSAAANALNSNGVDSAVTFTIADGTYTGQVSLRNISGASSSNTILFRSKSQDYTKVTITNTSTYTLYFYGADYVTFQDVTIENTYRYSYNIYLNNSSNNNSFKDCYIVKDYQGSTNYNVYNYRCDDLTFDGCTLEGSYYAIRSWGWSTSRGVENLTFVDCRITKAYYYGIYSYYSEDLTVHNTVMDSFGAGGYNYGIFSYYGNRSSIKRNKLLGNSLGLSYENRSNSRDSSEVYNNMVSNDDGGYGWYGFYPYRVKAYNNSFYFNGAPYGMYLYYPSGSRFVNNNLEGNCQYYGILMYGAPTEWDYNNMYFSGSSSYAIFNSRTYNNFSALVSGQTNYNQNSIYSDPDYENDQRNLRSFCPLVNNSGDLRLKEDIDGNKRPNTTDAPKTDIGCNEFYVAPKDLDIKTITSPLSVKTSANTITAVFKNSGSTTLNNEIVTFQYSVDSGKTWTSQTDTINNLDPKDEYTISFSQTWTPTRTGDFRVHVKADPSVDKDPDSNDETFIDVCSGLSGTFTVGSPSADFPTLADAFKKLDCGLASHTTFQLVGGTYGQIKIANLNGTSANSTLTIDGQHVDSVTINHSANGFEGSVDIANSDYVTIKNMTIRSSTNTGAGVRLTDGSDFNLVEGCNVVTNNSSYYQNVGVAITGSGYRSATKGSNNTIKDCNILGHYYAVTFYAGNNSDQSQNALIDNRIDDFYYAGIWAYYQDSIIVDNNDIIKDGNRYQYGYTFYNYRGQRSNIVNNYLEGYGYYGYYCYYENQSNQSYTSLFANNLLNGICYYASTYGYPLAYFGYYSYNYDILHNTFVYDPTTSATRVGFGQGSAIYVYYNQGVDIVNNIFHSLDNSGTGVAFWDYYSNIADFDHNTFITSNSNLASQNASNISNLAALQSTYNGKNLNSYDADVFYAGNGDYRLSTTRQNHRGVYLNIDEDVDGDTRCSFAPSIGADESGYPTPKTRAFFAVDDTVYINSPVTFSNAAKKNDPIQHQWFVDGNYVSDVTDLEYRFTSTGTYSVSVVSEGCGGQDSFGRQVVVVLPTSAPKADFLTSSTTVDINEAVNFTNISSNGPDSFYWRVDSYFVRGQYGFPIKSHSFVNGTDTNSANPEIEFLSPGTYSICLYAYNLRGMDSMCKMQHIKVRQTVDMCGVSTFSSNSIGKLFDEGGPAGNYTANRNLCDFLLDPCTDEIKLTINAFDLAQGSYLRIYDGKDNSGKPLHAFDPAYSQGLTGSIQDATFKKTFTATSGEVYFEFTSAGATASGFEIEWEARVVSASTPVAAISLPDTVCAEVPFTVSSNSTGLDIDYAFYMDTSNINWFNGPDYRDETFTHQYDFAGTYYVKMNATNCGGMDSLIVPIVVVAPTTPPTPAFTVNNSRPSIGDRVMVTNASTSGSYPCIGEYEWSISPSTYSFVDGYNKNTEDVGLLFSDTGCYDITLTVSNSAGDSSYTMKCAVYSISTCIPNVKIPNTDVGISRVAIGNIDNSSDINEDGYESFVNGSSTNLEIGATYSITIERPAGGTNPMNRAVWVDYNQDGVFDNSSEMVTSSKADGNTSWTGSFAIPTSALKGSTRMRVGANLGSFAQYGCGPNQFGEFEDYRVFVTADQQAPVVTVTGAADTTIEQCATWTDPSATALDNVDGTINLSGTLGSVDESTPGKYTITYEATDAAGNVGRATRTVNVSADATAPTITLSGQASMDLEVFAPYTEPGFTADDNCGSISASDVTVTGTVDNTELGINTLTYTVTDKNGISTNVTRTVNVVDTEAPVIVNVLGDNPANVEVLTQYTEAGVEWTENYDTAGLTYKVSGNVDVSTPGTYTLRYTVTDNSGNVSAEATRTVVVADGTAPDLRLALGDTTLTIDVYDAYKAEWVDIDDNFSSESSVRNTLTIGGTYVTTFGNGAATETGQFTFTYTAEDESGNSTTVTRDIIVADREAPTMTFADRGVVTLQRWQAFDAANDVAYDLDDNYHAAATLVVSVASNNVDVNTTGKYQIVYEVSDPDDNTGSYPVTVVVSETAETIGIDEVAEITADLYPNPTNGQLNVAVTLPSTERVRIAVVNALGQEVMVIADQTAQTVNTTADLSALTAGVYNITIVTSNQSIVKRVSVTD